jgi:dihydroorotase
VDGRAHPLLHISSAEELRPLADAKARGVDITGETCPHYLFLSSDDYARCGGVIRVNPPVREARNQSPLWQALANGTLDIIATDHAPHAPPEKTRNDIWSVDCGFPGVETQMSLMLSALPSRHASICDYVRWSAYNPARIWGLAPHKGAIQVGADADLAIVDLGREMVLDDAALQSRSKISPWHGRSVKGMPIHTLVRGRFIMRDRVLQDDTPKAGVAPSTRSSPCPRRDHATRTQRWRRSYGCRNANSASTSEYPAASARRWRPTPPAPDRGNAGSSRAPPRPAPAVDS